MLHDATLANRYKALQLFLRQEELASTRVYVVGPGPQLHAYALGRDANGRLAGFKPCSPKPERNRCRNLCFPIAAMSTGWFGIPWYVYAAICLAIALVYSFVPVAPVKRYAWAARPVWRYLILRWFHAAVWLLLAAACLVRQAAAAKGGPAANALALAALACYVSYLIVLLLEKKKRPL